MVVTLSSRTKGAVLNALIVILLLSSCKRPELPEFARTEFFKGGVWNRGARVRFVYKPVKTGKKNVFIFLENTNDYPYSNIFIIAKMQHGGQVAVDTFEYEMAEGTGKWLGRKVKNTYENLFVYKLNWPVKDTTQVVFELEPATRRVDKIEGDIRLKGVASVGIIVEAVKQNSDNP